MLGDIDIVIFNLKPGSIFLLTVNIEEKINKRRFTRVEDTDE